MSRSARDLPVMTHKRRDLRATLRLEHWLWSELRFTRRRCAVWKNRSIGRVIGHWGNSLSGVSAAMCLVGAASLAIRRERPVSFAISSLWSSPRSVSAASKDDVSAKC